MRRHLALALLLCLAVPLLRAADAPAGAIAKNAKAVVRVSATLHSEMSRTGQPARKNDKRNEIAGTVLDASGLTVVSLTVLDPSDAIRELLAAMDNKISIKTEVSDLTIRTGDNKEVPARLIYKDPELDLAFLVPAPTADKPMPEFTPITSATAPEVQLLDRLLTVSRLDKTLQSAEGAKWYEVNAIVRKPRTMYMCSNADGLPKQSNPTILLGSPALAADGALAGLWVVSRLPATAGPRSAQPEPIVLPAATVLEAAKQAREAKNRPAAQDGGQTETK